MRGTLCCTCVSMLWMSILTCMFEMSIDAKASSLSADIRISISWRKAIPPPGRATPNCVSPTAIRASSANMALHPRKAVLHCAEAATKGRMSTSEPGFKGGCARPLRNASTACRGASPVSRSARTSARGSMPEHLLYLSLSLSLPLPLSLYTFLSLHISIHLSICLFICISPHH